MAKREILSLVTTWMDFRLNERIQTQKEKYCVSPPICESQKIDFIEVERLGREEGERNTGRDC
jgi:hypothetical protein